MQDPSSPKKVPRRAPFQFLQYLGAIQITGTIRIGVSGSGVVIVSMHVCTTAVLGCSTLVIAMSHGDGCAWVLHVSHSDESQ